MIANSIKKRTGAKSVRGNVRVLHRQTRFNVFHPACDLRARVFPKPLVE